MSIKNGDFILVDYTGRIKETGLVFDTTQEEVAKKEGTFRVEEIYEPKLIVIGEGWMLPALEESFLNNQIGKTATVEIPPEKAFGTRDPEKVRMISRRWLSSRGITPQIGMQLEYDGRPAVVRTVGAGRVQLDFNPPLAGKTLVYEVTVQEKLGTIREKINALVNRRLPFVKGKTDLKTRKSVVTITIPQEAFYVEGLQIAKRGIALDIQKFLPQMLTVRYVEEHTTPNQVPNNDTS